MVLIGVSDFAEVWKFLWNDVTKVLGLLDHRHQRPISPASEGESTPGGGTGEGEMQRNRDSRTFERPFGRNPENDPSRDLD